MTLGEVFAQLIGWLGNLVDWTLSWFPRMIVLPSDEVAVKQVGGQAPVRLDPGIHWIVPAITDVTGVHTSVCVMGIRSLALETQDGIAVQVGGVLVYRVSDPVAYITKNYEAEAGIEEVAMAGFREAVQCSTWEELVDENETSFDHILPARVADALDRFGIEVLNVQPTDLVRLDNVSRHFGINLLSEGN